MHWIYGPWIWRGWEERGGEQQARQGEEEGEGKVGPVVASLPRACNIYQFSNLRRRISFSFSWPKQIWRETVKLSSCYLQPTWFLFWIDLHFYRQEFDDITVHDAIFPILAFRIPHFIGSGSYLWNWNTWPLPYMVSQVNALSLDCILLKGKILNITKVEIILECICIIMPNISSC